jgi:hypothetical protein
VPKDRQIDIKETVVAMEGEGIFENCVLDLKEGSSLKPFSARYRKSFFYGNE